MLRVEADTDRSLFVLQVATLPMGFMAVLVMDFWMGLDCTTSYCVYYRDIYNLRLKPQPCMSSNYTSSTLIHSARHRSRLAYTLQPVPLYPI